MLISLIVAVSDNQVIGKNNKMPWHLPRDLKYFKKITSNHCVIMGRKTYESIQDAIGSALPNRHNIVISRNKDYQLIDADVCNDLDSAIALAKKSIEKKHTDNNEPFDINDEIFIIGGASLFNVALEFADKVYQNRVSGDFDGDAFFPTLDEKNWRLISSEKYNADNKNAYDLKFEIYEKVKSC